MAKLYIPLFYNGMFNVDEKKIRVDFVKEISNGAVSYELWKRAGKQDIEYPRNENDKYLLYVLQNDHLIPLRITEYRLIDLCGYPEACKKLYGGREGRTDYFDKLRKSKDRDKLIENAISKENEEIDRFGNDPAVQTDYIFKELQTHIGDFRKALENGGETWPDLIGAFLLGEVSKCQEIAAICRDKENKEREKRIKESREKNRRFVHLRNLEAQYTLVETMENIRKGGTVANESIALYTLTEDSYIRKESSVLLQLMKKYGINVPLRTQSWINEKLLSICVENGKLDSLTFNKAKNCRCSETVFTCLYALLDKLAAA